MTYVATVKYNKELDEYYLASDLFEELGWEVDDEISWTIDENNSVSMKNITKN